MSALLLTLLVHAASPAEIPETWTVKPGDTCEGVVRAVWGDRRKLSELHRWNELGPLPHLLQPGMVLRLRPPPAEPPGPAAVITFLKPAVRARHLLDWAPARQGMDLFRLDEVNTLRGAGARLSFRDTSTLQLDENALVVIYGDAQGSRPEAPTGVTLIDGELRVALASLRAKPLELATPAAKLRVAGFNGVASVDGAQTSRVSVFDGQASVSAKGVTVTVPARHGTRVRPGLPPEPPRQLPEAPVVQTPRIVLTHPDSEGLLVAWGPAARAVRYRVQVAADEAFVDRLRDVFSEETQVRVQGLPVGRFFMRVISFDEIGLQSPPSVHQPFDVVTLSVPVSAAGLAVLSPGQPLDVEAGAGVQLQLDDAPWNHQALTAGAHVLTVLDRDGAVLTSQRLVRLPRPPTTHVTREGRIEARFDEPVPATMRFELEGSGDHQRFTLDEATQRWSACWAGEGPVVLEIEEHPVARVELAPTPAARCAPP